MDTSVFKKLWFPFEKHIGPGLVELRVNGFDESGFGKVVLEIADSKGIRDKKFLSDKHITKQLITDFATVLSTLVGQTYNKRDLKCVIPDLKHRVTIGQGDYFSAHTVVAIRIFSPKIYTIQDYACSDFVKKAIVASIQEGDNLLVCSATSAGKTSLINALLRYLPKTRRVVSVENAQELRLEHFLDKTEIIRPYGDKSFPFSHVGDLINRISPEAVAIGELDSENTPYLLRAINTGQKNCIGTLHCNSNLKSLVSALTMNLRLGGLEIPDLVASEYICNSLDGAIFMSKPNYGLTFFKKQTPTKSTKRLSGAESNFTVDSFLEVS